MAAYTITEALTKCGVLIDTNNIVFDGNNTPKRISGEVFNDSFNTCIDMAFSELEDNWVAATEG